MYKYKNKKYVNALPCRFNYVNCFYFLGKDNMEKNVQQM